MTSPFVIDNQEHRLATVLKALLARSAGTPLVIATADFSLSGNRLVRDGLQELGAFVLLSGQHRAPRLLESLADEPAGLAASFPRIPGVLSFSCRASSGPTSLVDSRGLAGNAADEPLRRAEQWIWHSTTPSSSSSG